MATDRIGNSWGGVVLMDNIECTVCGSKNTEMYLDKIMPTFLFPVPQELIEKVEFRHVYLYICNHCSHIFQTRVDKDLINLIYNVFYEHYNLDTSAQFQEVYYERFKEFFVRNSNSGKLVDIGCNKAPLFPFFESMGLECYGIEPSKRNAEIAMKNNPKSHISNVFFEASGKNVFGEKFDVIQMNFVMEHIIDLDEFFEKLEMYSKDETKMFLQVPDTEYYLKNNIDPFCVEHINYFTYRTLKILLERKGFEVVDMLHGDAPSLIVCAEYKGNPKIKFNPNEEGVLFKKDFVRSQKDLIEKIRRIVKEEKTLVLYGMGLTAYWISSVCRDIIPDKLMLIDDNDFYQGKVVPGFNQNIQSCPKMELHDALILITTSPPYFPKIRKLIKNSFTGKYRVGYVKHNDVLIEEVEGVP